jgi:hypothetical protein
MQREDEEPLRLNEVKKVTERMSGPRKLSRLVRATWYLSRLYIVTIETSKAPDKQLKYLTFLT